MLKKLKGILQLQEGEIVGVASTEDIDRHNEVIKQDGWDLKNFLSNPVMMLSHDYHDFPVAKVTDVAVENGKLNFKAKFTKATQTAKEAYQLVKEGILNTVSVGFIPREFDAENPNIITKAELLEISLVAVPANPNAVIVAKEMKDNKLAEKFVVNWMVELKELEKEEKKEKAVVPFKAETPADAGAAWDGPGEMMACGDDMGKLKRICAWYDAGNPDVKASYKLPHHQASDMKVVWKGVAAAMAALLGARGGTKIPAGDRQGVYNHLAKHYAQFEKEPPEFKTIEYFSKYFATVRAEKNSIYGEDGKEVGNVDLKILQQTVGFLQDLCRIKKLTRKESEK